MCTPKRRTLRAPSGHLLPLCTSLKWYDLQCEDLALTRDHLKSTQTTLIFFPQVKSTHTKSIVLHVFFLQKMIFPPNSRIIVLQGSQSHWYLHHGQLTNLNIKSMPLATQSSRPSAWEELLSSLGGRGRPSWLHFNAAASLGHTP